VLTLKTYTGLAQHVAEVMATDETPVSHIEFGELADGSRRYYALITTYDNENDLEQTYRVTSPAPEDAPRWVHLHPSFFTYRLEVRVGEDWLDLDPDEDGLKTANSMDPQRITRQHFEDGRIAVEYWLRRLWHEAAERDALREAFAIVEQARQHGNILNWTPKEKDALRLLRGEKDKSDG
jgi:hypothetical protein